MKTLIIALATSLFCLITSAQVGPTFDELKLELKYITTEINLLVTYKYPELKKYSEIDNAKESQAISYRKITNAIK